MSKEDQSQSSPTAVDTHTPKVKDLRLPAALVRTALSSEQTMMSWIRTSLSLIAFGFSVTQFFYYLAQQQGGSELSTGPRRLGIAMIGAGILALVCGVAEHLYRLRKIKEQGLPPDSMSPLPIGSAAALLIVGIVALADIILN